MSPVIATAVTTKVNLADAVCEAEFTVTVGV